MPRIAFLLLLGVLLLTPGCGPVRSDLDSDDDVDNYDLAIFLGCMTGPNIPADPKCAD